MPIDRIKDCHVAEIDKRSRAAILKIIKNDFGGGVLLPELAARFKDVPARAEPRMAKEPERHEPQLSISSSPAP